jgi:hypothetical protein
MFLHFFLHSSAFQIHPNSNISVKVGAVSNLQNPFWSQRIPGVHFCPEPSTLPIDYSFMERKLILPFIDSDSDFLHCSLLIDHSSIKALKKVAREDSFIRFYAGLRTVRARLFQLDPDSSDIRIATHFVIRIDRSADAMSVTPERFSMPVLAQPLNVSFAVRIEAGMREPILAGKNGAIFAIGAGLFVIAAILSVGYGYRWRFVDKPAVPFREIWRITELYPNLLVFTGVGALFVAAGVVISVVAPGRFAAASVLQNVALLVLIVPVGITCLIARTFSLRLDDPGIVAPQLLYFTMIVIPAHIFSIFCGLFGSFRGYRIRYLIVTQPIYAGLLVEMSRGFGNVGALLHVPFVIEPRPGASNFQLAPLGSKLVALNIVVVLLNILGLAPVCRHLVEVLCDDAPIEYGWIMSVVVVYGGAAAVSGLIRTIHRLTRLTRHWSESHIVMHGAIAIGVMVIIVAHGLKRYGIPEWEVAAAFAMLAWGAGSVVVSIGVFFSYAWSFVTVVGGLGGVSPS